MLSTGSACRAWILCLGVHLQKTYSPFSHTGCHPRLFSACWSSQSYESGIIFAVFQMCVRVDIWSRRRAQTGTAASRARHAPGTFGRGHSRRAVPPDPRQPCRRRGCTGTPPRAACEPGCQAQRERKREWRHRNARNDNDVRLVPCPPHHHSSHSTCCDNDDDNATFSHLTRCDVRNDSDDAVPLSLPIWPPTQCIAMRTKMTTTPM